MSSKEDVFSEKNILYELLIYAEWNQELELQNRGSCDKVIDLDSEGLFSWMLGSLAPPLCPPIVIRRLNEVLLPWAFSTGGNGAVIAILQDTSLEIRTSRDEYGAVIGKTQVSTDPHPQWRRILWSPDCTMLACASSSGQVDFFDLIGAHMFTIDKANSAVTPKMSFGNSIAGMAFSDVRAKNTQWSYEFLVATYSGNISGYFISPADGFTLNHSFSLSSKYPFGISSFAYSALHGMIFVSGNSPNLKNVCGCKEAADNGLSAWRLLQGFPYYKVAMTTEDLSTIKNNSWKNTFYNYGFFQKYKEDLVFKMSISPSGRVLAAVHISGALSLWDLPTLRLKKLWPLTSQPGFAETNPYHSEPGSKTKDRKSEPFRSHIIDVNWWSDEALIVVRQCGAVTVSSTSSLQNLLGVSAEWFANSPAVTSFCDRGFLAIEKEVRFKGKRRNTNETEEDDDSSDEEDVSVFTYTYNLAQRALYVITDLDRFQPPQKKTKLKVDTYRLLCLKSTTPEELFTRKINNEEYGEALSLAQTYDLDSDLVYQRQWRQLPATVETIHDYLSKIKKRSWVLHECLERMPDGLEATRELLAFGLRGTDAEALLAVGCGDDRDRFILSTTDSDEELEFSYNSHIEDPYEISKKYAEKKRTEFLKKVNFKKLTLEQKQLCECRLKLLLYLDRLDVYEVILGGPIYSEERFDAKFFRTFRSQCGLELAVCYANDSDWEAVATLFTYMGDQTLPHQLSVLSQFPETTDPLEYQSLLPLYNEHEGCFSPWEEHELREPDWSETRFKMTFETQMSVPNADYIEDFYEKNKDLSKYRNNALSCDLVTEWFTERAKLIEDRCSLVENSLHLLKSGMERNIPGLEKLHSDLTVLEMMIYDCDIKRDISLKQYTEMAQFDRIKLLMSNTSKETFMANVQLWLNPFLIICEKHAAGSAKLLFKEYLLHVSKDDLYFCKKVIEHSMVEALIISDFYELVNMSLDCIYICESTDQLKNASAILENLHSFLDTSNRNSVEAFCLPETVSSLKKHLIIAELMEKHGLSMTLSMVRDVAYDAEKVKKALTKLARMNGHRSPSLKEDEWIALLADILEMQRVLFKCVRYEDCYEIVLYSLLCSGKLENIAFCGQMMECNRKKQRKTFGNISYSLPFDKSVDLVLIAAREFFNSASDASDPCMGLAKSCLNLIEDAPPAIEEEFNLISAMTLLQEFDVNMLPLQVRLCEDRLTLVEEALQRKDNGYKKPQKLMKLAYLLGAVKTDDHEREGKVLVLIGEYAFKAKDYSECFQTCKKLVDSGHKEGWQICRTLGSCPEFKDITIKLDLISFALAHCSEDLIETILVTKSELQLQILQERVKFLVGHEPFDLKQDEIKNETVGGRNADIADTLWSTGGRTLQVTTDTAKAVLSTVKNVQFWKEAVNWIPSQAPWWSDDSTEEEQGSSNARLLRQGSCAFYGGLVPSVHLSNLEANYQRYARPDLSQQLEISSSILRASLLQDSLKGELNLSSVDSSVILDMAKAYLPEDTLYSFSILLSLHEAGRESILFGSLPISSIMLELLNFYYACKIQIAFGNLPFEKKGIDIKAFIKEVLLMEEMAQSKPQCKKYFVQLKKYDKQLYDYLQAEILHSIGGGVDAIRFANDDTYKKDTILGIAMTVDDSIYRTASSLAMHYGVPMWSVCMAHLEFLFSDPSISATVLNERIEKLGLREQLLEKRKMSESRLREHVYPGIGGKEHEKLVSCLSLLEECGDNEDDLGIKPSTHKKMLAKFQGAMKNLDYKQLMSADSSLSYLSSVLNESNVHVFAKAASSIPMQNGEFHTSSNIYCLWAQKYFFEGNSANHKVPSTKTEWIHRYESCSDLLQRLEASDVLQFVSCTLFTRESLKKMNVDCRCDILKRVLKLCRAKVSKLKGLSEEWNSAVAQLTSWREHLQRLEEEATSSLRESSEGGVRAEGYWEEFDLSKSDITKLQQLLLRIVVDGPDLELLETFIACCPPAVEREPSDVYLEATAHILQTLRDPECLEKNKSDFYIQRLEAILENISQHKEELMVEDIVAECLYEFCQDTQVPIPIRLSILQLLEKTDCLSEEYRELLLLLRTQTIASSIFPDLQVSEEDVKDEFQRNLLYEKLLSTSNTANHYLSISKLLSHWPHFPYSEERNCTEEQWTKLLLKMVEMSSKEALDGAICTLQAALTAPSFTQQCHAKVLDAICAKGSILHSFKCALMSDCREMHSKALNVLHTHTAEVNTADYDDELLDALLRHGLAPQVVSSGLYPPLVQHLVHRQDDGHRPEHVTVRTVAKQLLDAGCTAEAGSLLLLQNVTHEGLGSFSAALASIRHWLQEN